MAENYNKYLGSTLNDRYSIINIIGLGGTSIVFGAFDCISGKTVAIKMLRDIQLDNVYSVKQFQNDADTLSLLNHPNIVNILDTDISCDNPAFVMEYVEGITLRSHMDYRGKLPTSEVIYHTIKILNTLSYLKIANVVHSDLKPQNIMLLKNGEIKLTDFGIAKRPNSEPLTASNTAVGTVSYVSPEQASGKPLGTESDIYSLGIMMFEMLTGQLPFSDESSDVVIHKHLEEAPPRPRKINPNIPKGLEQIILKALEKDPEDRFTTPNDMLKCVEELRKNPNATFSFKKSKKKKRSSSSDAQDAYSRSTLSVLLGAASAFVVVFIISAIVIMGNFIVNNPDTPKRIKIPNLVGKTYESAKKAGLSSDYYVVNIEYEYTNSKKPNTILSQYPEGGTSHELDFDTQHCVITLVLSETPYQTVMSDYTVMPYEDAAKELDRLGFEVVIVEDFDNIVDKGLVSKTEPSAGSPLMTGDSVTVFVSKGEKLVNKNVPNFCGMSETAALALIDAEGFIRGNITYERSDSAVGTVIAQSVAANSTVNPSSTRINLTISGGAAY